MSEPRLEPPSPADPSPLWREELPIHATDERYVDRRQLAKFLVLTSLGMLAGNLWILAKGWWTGKPAYTERLVARVGDLAVGGVRLFRYPGLGNLLVDSILVKDVNTAQGIIVLLIFLVLTLNLIIDLCLPLFDPRVKYRR